MIKKPNRFIKNNCIRCSGIPLFETKGGLKTYACTCGMKAFKCNTPSCPKWHETPRKQSRIMCDHCEVTQFYCACETFYAVPNTDISFVCSTCDTHMDPPLETSGNFKSSSIFNSPIKPKKPVPHVQATHDKHKGRDTEN